MSEPPSPDGRPARSDAASRLAALLADVVEHPAPAPDDVHDTSTPAARRAPRARRSSDPDRTEDLATLLAGRTATRSDASTVTKVAGAPAPAETVDPAPVETVDSVETVDPVDPAPVDPAPVDLVDAPGPEEPADRGEPIADQGEPIADQGEPTADQGEPTAELDALPPAPPAEATVPIPGPPPSPEPAEVAARPPAVTARRAEVAAGPPVVTAKRTERTRTESTSVDAGPPTEVTATTGDAAAPRGARRGATRPPAAPSAPAVSQEAPPPVAPDEVATAEPPGRRAPRLTLRAVAFGIVFALLVAAVPALGWVGKDRLLESKGGTIVEGNAGLGDPGYLAAVDPTPTALVVLRDADDRPASVAVLAKGAGDTGGTVLLVPLTLQPIDTTWFRTILDGYDAAQDDDGFRRSIEDVLKVSVPPPIIDLDDASLATLVAPVAPLQLTVTDPVQLEDDGRFLSGPVELSAEEVGPFLRATREGEPEVAQLERARDLWEAWLAAIGGATATEPIGAASTGIGDYLRVLSAGDPVVEVLDVQEDAVYTQPVLVPGPNLNEQVISAVPFPQSPREGTRFNVEVVNGARGEVLPMELLRDLTLAGASLAFIGNADEFGQEDTVIQYAGAEWRDVAEFVAEMLGPSATAQEMPARRAESETEDLVITIGSDVLAQYEE